MDRRNLVFAGVLAWVIAGIPSMSSELERYALTSAHAVAFIAAYLLVIVLFVAGTRDGRSRRARIICVVGQALLTLACIALEPESFIAILLVMVAGQLGTLPFRTALVWIALQTVAMGMLIAKPAALWAALAYFAFQLFGLFSIRIAHQESDARQALAEANAELQVANGLLDIGSRTEERLRISRDLHDVLGHHLTALSLNLEVASHLTEGEAREQIEKSKALTKVLLTDVREVVSRLRHHEPVDLAAALHALQGVIERPSITLDVRNELAVEDPAVAQVALRMIQEIVTNAVRHSGARSLRLAVSTDSDALTISGRDDGAGTDNVQFGHGLRGMQERVEQLHGTMRVTSMRGQGFEVSVRIPLHEVAA